MPTLITTTDAAEILGVDASRIRQLIIEGKLTATKMGRDNLLDRAEVQRFGKKDRPVGRPPAKRRKRKTA